MGKLLFLRNRPVELIASPIPSDVELITAVFDNSSTQVEDLLCRGVNVNAVEAFSECSAIGMAAFFSEVKVVRLLVSYGADLSQRDKLGQTPLHNAAKAGLKRSLTITEVLLTHGADINAVCHEGWTPLMTAVSRQNVELVKLLMERGADSTMRNSEGKRAVDLIIPGKNEAALRLLLGPVS
jgi:uncharacterized protein